MRARRDVPPHVALLDLRRGAVSVIADVNPEFRNIPVGKPELYEFDNPRFAWNEPGGALAGLYAARGYGYILYPQHRLVPLLAAGHRGPEPGQTKAIRQVARAAQAPVREPALLTRLLPRSAPGEHELAD